ncbi:lipoate--protein ligase family protein [Sporolactobacillus shoreae]|uniref:Octanoyl-[GcvH]:protein N-octanoyltransferase n=1 Tax=Sporolactobacillus shoreae TaxID=1465501 RepID=A0A4Z0GPP7_9BACL|nr:lipoate--protein ligase family protein [Sporolactobacillus shoreae]TGA98006.1 lipoate--protein ligase family protein [Sporolactobacillus shoreae]
MSLLNQPLWRVFDQSTLGDGFDGRQSFALDDTLCESVGSGASPSVARLWVHQSTVMLGIQDTRLPHLKNALDVLDQAGFNYIVRNSGGLAVVLDEGVLNLSLIFSEKERQLSIDEPFQAMADFIKNVLDPFQIRFETGEITRSYCPGRYDLSTGGRKFAGISQRRVRNGVAVQIYLCVSGSGTQRGDLIRSFYREGLQGEAARFSYPDVDPTVMASLEEISGSELTVAGAASAVIRALQSTGKIVSISLSDKESRLFGAYYERMIRRNDKAFENL